jgi:hypothetical protein
VRALLLSLLCLSTSGLTSCHLLAWGVPYVTDSRTVKWSGTLDSHRTAARRLIKDPEPQGYIGGYAEMALGHWNSMTLMQQSGDQLVPWTTPLKDDTPVVLLGHMDSCTFGENHRGKRGPSLEQVLVVKSLVKTGTP